MGPETTEIQVVLERVEQLERQNRRMKRGWTIASLLVVAWVTMGATTHRNQTIEAREFRLKDAQGRLRASLGVSGDFTHLLLFGENSKGWAELMVSDHSAQVKLSGPDGAFAILDVTDKVASSLHLHHSNSWAGVLALKDAVDLTLSTPDAAEAKLVTMQPRAAYPVAEGASSATLGVDLDGPYLNVHDKGSFQTSLGNVGLTTPTTGETQRTSAASLVMFGKDGKVIWRAP